MRHQSVTFGHILTADERKSSVGHTSTLVMVGACRHEIFLSIELDVSIGGDEF